MYSHFFGGKKTEEKETKTESQTEEPKAEAKTDSKAEAEKPKEAPKAAKIPETYEGLIESLPAEHKKRLIEVYKKLEAENSKNAKAVKELNEKVRGFITIDFAGYWPRKP